MQASKKLSTTKTHNNQAMQFRFKKRKKKAMQFREMVKEIYIYIKKTYFGMHVKDSSQISASKSKISKVSAIPIFPLINWWNTEIIFMHVENTAKILL